MYSDRTGPKKVLTDERDDWQEWFEVLNGVLDKSVEREEVIEGEFENLQLDVPTTWGSQPEYPTGSSMRLFESTQM